MSLKLRNTYTRLLEDFVAISPDRVGMYTCGPTVYDYAHIGNLRTYVFEDLLKRTLMMLGYEPYHVMNVTDVGHLTDDADEGEDKMVKSSREKKMSVWEIAEHYTQAFFADFRDLNCLMPDQVCRATDHIPEMIDLIRRIEANGYTYASGGNLYFDISRFPSYGKMALLDLDELQAGARVGVDQNKRNPHDFVLWFTRSKFEHQAMLWDSPWGRGYPGWHIECSAMAMKYLGEQFDIHCGGIDAIAVHHTNEIAQSEAATGMQWVKYWLHGEFLVMDKIKMAKSRGNIVTVSSLRDEGFHPLDYRYFLLNAHYRSPLQFTLEALRGARNARRNLVERVARCKSEADPEALESAWQPPGGSAGAHVQRFTEHLSEDLNVPRALAEAWNLVKDEGIDAGDRVRALEYMDGVLGLDLAAVAAADTEIEEELVRLVEEREAARKRRDFVRADQIRSELAVRGIVLEDTPGGVRWRKSPDGL